MRKTWWVISLIVAVAILLSYCSSQDVKPNDTDKLTWLNHHDTVKYVGMEVCRECHSDKHKTFIHTGMGQSFDRASKAKSVADFHSIRPVYDKFKDLYYRPFWEDSTFFILEYRLDQGDTVHKRLEKIDYIVGSGQHTNSHIFRLNGYLYQAPLTWYQQEGKWDLPPGFEDGQNSRFSRTIGYECMTCHNAYPEFDFNSTNRFYKVPSGIDCERCHGPGELHVQEKRAGNLVDISHDTDFTIVNPSKLSWDRQVDVCQRCHLQGNAVLKDGKDFDDFKPGMILRDFMQVFMPKYEGGDDEFIMASHAQRLQRSQCFIKSNQSGNNVFTCISCHNPHISVKVTGKAVFNNSCQSCHETDTCTEDPNIRLKADNNCVKCHMPTNRPTDIPHVTVHDHYIRKPDNQNTKTLKKRFIGLYAVNDPDPSALEKARAYLSHFEKFNRKEKMYLDSASLYLKTLGNPDKEYLRYLYLAGDFKALTEVAKGKQFQDAWTNYRVGRAFHVLQQNAQALPYLEKAVRSLPGSLEFGNEHAACLLELGRFKEAKRQFEDLLRKQPKQVQALNNLGYLYFLGSDLSKAKKHYQEALSLDPDYVPAMLNLSNLLHQVGDDKQARIWLERAQKLEPSNERIRKSLDLLSNNS